MDPFKPAEHDVYELPNEDAYVRISDPVRLHNDILVSEGSCHLVIQEARRALWDSEADWLVREILLHTLRSIPKDDLMQAAAREVVRRRGQQ